MRRPRCQAPRRGEGRIERRALPMYAQHVRRLASPISAVETSARSAPMATIDGASPTTAAAPRTRPSTTSATVPASPSSAVTTRSSPTVIPHAQALPIPSRGTVHGCLGVLYGGWPFERPLRPLLLEPSQRSHGQCLLLAGALSPQWWRHRRLFGQADYRGLSDPQEGICVLTLTRREKTIRCRRLIARAVRGGELREFDVSPDGRLVVAAEYAPPELGRTRLAIFSTRTGHRVRTLTSRHDDHEPTFSPDGRTIVFAREAQSSPGPTDLSVVRSRGGRVHTVARLPYHGGNGVWIR